jgi:Transcriptional regulator
MPATIAKTRERLIEVARQLFARTGVENTTMNDIATASQKGRRTLYIYFKNKEDIYHAVLEAELSILYNSLDTVVQKNLQADQKLLELINTRFESIRIVVVRNGTLKANFFRNIWKVENVRKDFDAKEVSYIRDILKEGIDSGIFEVENPDSMALVLHHALKGLEVPYIRGIAWGKSSVRGDGTQSIINLLFNGIKKK